ncbi:MAG: hypothetical protein H3C31_00160, partial [Brumimicrobium sp.]|nr:hypothetical protein [Brumimicrobium sp.]
MKKQLLIFIFFLMGMGMSLAQQTIYVNAGATGANNGTSWADAYTDFQTAINNASSDDAVWVAAGTYQPTNSGEYFSMKEGVKIYGGFDGTETLLSERDWINNVTTLKG